MTFQNAGGINDFMAAETTHEFETAAETTHMVTEMTQRLCETREPVNDEYRHPRALYGQRMCECKPCQTYAGADISAPAAFSRAAIRGRADDVVQIEFRRRGVITVGAQVCQVCQIVLLRRRVFSQLFETLSRNAPDSQLMC